MYDSADQKRLAREGIDLKRLEALLRVGRSVNTELNQADEAVRSARAEVAKNKAEIERHTSGPAAIRTKEDHPTMVAIRGNIATLTITIQDIEASIVQLNERQNATLGLAQDCERWVKRQLEQMEGQ